MGEVRTVRKNINFPTYLLAEIDKATEELDVDFSKFIREATWFYIKTIKKNAIAKEIHESAKENEKFYKNLLVEYKEIDDENWP